MDLMVELEGNTVPLEGCDYVLWAACGCPKGVTQAGAHEVAPVVTEDDAWKQFYSRKAERAAAKKRGVRMELMTRQRYSAEVFPLMAGLCQHKAPAEQPTTPAEQLEVEIRNVDAGLDRRLLLDAARAVINHQNGSAKVMQRRICVGFVKAGRLMDLLEDAGIVGSYRGQGRPRQVLVPREHVDAAVAVLEKELADAATR